MIQIEFQENILLFKNKGAEFLSRVQCIVRNSYSNMLAWRGNRRLRGRLFRSLYLLRDESQPHKRRGSDDDRIELPDRNRSWSVADLGNPHREPDRSADPSLPLLPGVEGNYLMCCLDSQIDPNTSPHNLLHLASQNYGGANLACTSGPPCTWFN